MPLGLLESPSVYVLGEGGEGRGRRVGERVGGMKGGREWEEMKGGRG